MHSALLVHVRAMALVLATASKADHHELPGCHSPDPAAAPDLKQDKTALLLTATSGLPANREVGQKPAGSTWKASIPLSSSLTQTHTLVIVCLVLVELSYLPTFTTELMPFFYV